MQYLTNRISLTGTKYSLDEIVGVYGGATFDKANKELFAYTVFHNEATLEDIPIAFDEDHWFRIYFPETFTFGKSQVAIGNREEKIRLLREVMATYFRESTDLVDLVGYWLQDGKVIQENIVGVQWDSSYSTKTRFTSLVDWCRALKELLHQEALSLEIDDKILVLI